MSLLEPIIDVLITVFSDWDGSIRTDGGGKFYLSDARENRIKVRLYRLSMCLLLLNGIGALLGGFAFMIRPEGSMMGMEVSELQHTPFSSFLIPGLVLFLINGVSSIYILWRVLRKLLGYSRLILMQGVVLMVWIVIQVWWLQSLVPLHWILFALGLFLAVCGWLMRNREFGSGPSGVHSTATESEQRGALKTGC